MTQEEISEALSAVRHRIVRAAEAASRDPATITLVAVSKRKPVEDIRCAYAAGQRVFGENYVQELVSKSLALKDLQDLLWHHIGPIQTNKVRDVVRVAHTAETVDRVSLVSALQRRAALEERSMDVLIQVNVSGEETKSGCAPEELGAVLEAVGEAPRLRLRGLMTMPPYLSDPDDVRPFFATLRELRDRHGGHSLLPELSMGMSHDLEAAIAEGATIVRVGSAIFGSR